MAALGLVAGLYSGMAAANAEQQGGVLDYKTGVATYKAKQVEAKNVAASKQREGIESYRQAQLLASRAIAVAAAGGGSATDPTVAGIVADIHGEGAYRAMVSLYEGKTAANKLKAEAEYAFKAGQIKHDMAENRATSRWLSGATGAFSSYG